MKTEPREKWGMAFIAPFCTDSKWHMKLFSPNFVLGEEDFFQRDLKHGWPLYSWLTYRSQGRRLRGSSSHTRLCTCILVPDEEVTVMTGVWRRAALKPPSLFSCWHPTGIWNVFINSPRNVRCCYKDFFHNWHNQNTWEYNLILNKILSS